MIELKRRCFYSVITLLVWASTGASFQPCVGTIYRTLLLHGTADNWDVSDAPPENLEKAWRYAKKPLLSIGGKGATEKHGNSLRQLLEAHTVVKVKVNTQSFGDLQTAFEQLRDLAVQSGASDDIECVQAREFDKVIMFALPGTLARIKSGEFPPKEEEQEEAS